CVCINSVHRLELVLVLLLFLVLLHSPLLSFFFFNDTATTEIYTLSLHDALPIYLAGPVFDRHGDPIAERQPRFADRAGAVRKSRSEEHTSELQSPYDLVCRLLLEKKKKKTIKKQQTKHTILSISLNTLHTIIVAV